MTARARRSNSPLSSPTCRSAIIMSALKYINEPGAGQHLSDSYGYSQAVLINNTAKLSGQGGWDNEGNLEQYDWKQQITNAFDNVERVLKAAGFRGWEDVRLVFGRGFEE